MAHRQIGNLTGPKVITVIANRSLSTSADGIEAERGQRLEVAPVQAAQLTYQGKARFEDRQSPAAPRRRRSRPRSKSTYERRDLTAREN